MRLNLEELLQKYSIGRLDNMVQEQISQMWANTPEPQPYEWNTFEYFQQTTRKTVASGSTTLIHPHTIEREPMRVLANHPELDTVVVVGVHQEIEGRVYVRAYKPGLIKQMLSIRLSELNFADIHGSTIEKYLWNMGTKEELVIQEKNLRWHRRGLVEIIGETSDAYGNKLFIVSGIGELEASDDTVKFQPSEDELRRADFTRVNEFECYECELMPYELPDNVSDKLYMAFSAGTDDLATGLQEFVHVVKCLPRRPMLDAQGNQLIRPAKTKSGSVVLWNDSFKPRKVWRADEGWTTIGCTEFDVPIKTTKGTIIQRLKCVPNPVYHTPEVLAVGEDTGRMFVTKAFWLVDVTSGERLKWRNPDFKLSMEMGANEPEYMQGDEDYINYPDADPAFSSELADAFVSEMSGYDKASISDYIDVTYTQEIKGQLSSREKSKRRRDPVYKHLNQQASYWQVDRVKAKDLGLSKVKVQFTGTSPNPGAHIANVSCEKDGAKYQIQVHISESVLGELKISAPFEMSLKAKVFFSQEVSYQWAKNSLNTITQAN